MIPMNGKKFRVMFPSLLLIASLLIYDKVGKAALNPLLAVLCVSAVAYFIIATYNDRKARREEAKKAAEENAAGEE